VRLSIEHVWSARSLMRDRQRPTIIDIARVASVSASTVSRVINGKPDVSQRTKQLVVDTMLAHGFMVNPVARSLIGARMRVIGVRGSMAGPWRLGTDLPRRAWPAPHVDGCTGTLA
jgi:hypothetical protein